MIGYDAGARLGLDDGSTEPFGVIGAGYFQTPEITQSADAFRDAILEMDLKNDGNAAEPDSVIIAAADMTARMHGGIGENDDLNIGDSLLDINLSDVQQARLGYSGNGAGALFFNAEAAPSDHNYRAMADESPRSPDGSGGAIPASRVMGIQQSEFENDGGLSVADLAAAAVEKDQRHHNMANIAGLAGNLYDDDADTQVSDGIGPQHEFDFTPRSGENLPVAANWISRGSVDTDHLGELDELYARNLGGGNVIAGDTDNSAAKTGNGSNIFEDAATERAMGVGNKRDDDEYGVGQVLPESSDKTLSDRFNDAIWGGFGKGLARDGFSKGYVPGDIEAALAGFDGRLDELAGIGAIGKPIWPSMQDREIGTSENFQFPGGFNPVVRAQMNSPKGFGAYGSPGRMSADEGIANVPGLWDIFRNADRFLPKQAVLGQGGLNETVAQASEGAETGSMSWRAKDPVSSLDSFNPQASNIPPERTNPFGGRSGPSGHKDDPIYTVAIGQGTGMLMPMVPTSGTSTRSPPIPGQRNLS